MAPFVDVFRRHRYMFRAVGVSFDGELGRFGKFACDLQRWCVSFLMIYTHSICITVGVITRHHEFDLISNLVMACGIFSGPVNFCKHRMLYRRRHQIQSLINQVNGHKVGGGIGRFTRSLSYCYEGMSFFFTGASTVKNIIEIPDLTVPYPVWEPFEINTQPRRTLHFILVYYSITLCWVIIASVDTFILNIATQLCYKLSVLNHTLQLLGADEQERTRIMKENEVLPLKDFKDTTVLKTCLDEHLHLFELTKSLKDLMNETFVYQGINSMVLLLVCLYIFSNSVDLVNDTLAFSGAMVVVFIQVLTSCFSGELIKTRFEEIHFSVYNNHWYEVDTKLRSSLFMIATFSSRTVVLRGAYVFNLSLSTYETFIRQAFSFLAVFYQVLN